MSKKTFFYTLLKNIAWRFLRLNIAKKLMLGYLPLIGLILLSGSYALFNLEKLNTLNRSIIETDIPLIKSTEKMVESLYSQELYGNRYVILKSPKMMELFLDSGAEFKTQVKNITALLKRVNRDTRKLTTLHNQYNALFLKWFSEVSNPKFDQTAHTKKINDAQKQLIDQIKEISKKAGIDQTEKTIHTSSIGERAASITAYLGILSLILGFIAAFLITRNISKAINKMKKATREISKGNFEYTPEINNQDELGDLSNSFKDMAQRLKRLEEMNLDASPLSHLPGSNTIESVLKEHIKSGKVFAFCVVDLDNFKVFNDRYGYARGNEVILGTVEIIQAAMMKFQDPDNFIGHIGGDDFVVITGIGLYSKICNFIIEQFDQQVTGYYDPKDVEQGFIMGKTRQGVERNFPIMTVSIAIVTNQKKRNMHYLEFGEKAAELKEYVKSIEGSVYCVDRRRRNTRKKKG